MFRQKSDFFEVSIFSFSLVSFDVSLRFGKFLFREGGELLCSGVRKPETEKVGVSAVVGEHGGNICHEATVSVVDVPCPVGRESGHCFRWWGGRMLYLKQTIGPNRASAPKSSGFAFRCVPPHRVLQQNRVFYFSGLDDVGVRSCSMFTAGEGGRTVE